MTQGQQPPHSQISNRIIIKYKNTSALSRRNTLSVSDVSAISQQAGLKLKHLRRLSTGAQLMQMDRRLSLTELEPYMQALRNDPEVEYVEIDQMLQHQFTPNDPVYSYQWQYHDPAGGINMPSAWDITQGTGVVVAVIDSGYRPHTDLVANILPGYDMISDLEVAQDNNGRDSDASDPGNWAPADACEPGSSFKYSTWHGTHVAGTVAAVTNNNLAVAGVAYGAKLLPVRVLGRCGGHVSDIADGIIWAAGGSVNAVPSNANPAQVLNLSLGGTGVCSNTTQSAINTARGLGATVVVAAGNKNTDAANVQPANCDGVITVAASNRYGNEAHYYTNYGSVVDVSAPGGDTRSSGLDGIYSLSNTGKTTPDADNYSSKQGTSMSAAHVSGVVALLYALDPNMNPDTAENIVKTTARDFTSACTLCGTGIVDANAAVVATGAIPPPTNVTLSKGIAVTGLAGNSATELHYSLAVPISAIDLNFALSGGSGNADLYVKFGSVPTTTDYDCRPYLADNNETCAISTVQEGTYYILVRTDSSFSDVDLVGQYSEPNTGGDFITTGLSGSLGSWQHFFIDVSAGTTALDVQMSEGTGDADLYVRYGETPTSTSYDCRPYRSGNNESCNFSNPQAGTWYISIHAYSSYSGVTLQAQRQ